VQLRNRRGKYLRHRRELPVTRPQGIFRLNFAGNAIEVYHIFPHMSKKNPLVENLLLIFLFYSEIRSKKRQRPILSKDTGSYLGCVALLQFLLI
jgi:hypothetical protein